MVAILFFLNTLVAQKFGLFWLLMLQEKYDEIVNTWIVICELAVTQIIGAQNCKIGRDASWVSTKMTRKRVRKISSLPPFGWPLQYIYRL